MRPYKISAYLAAVLTLLLSGAATAEDAKAEQAKQSTKVQSLLTQPLAGVTNKEVLMLTVEYLPGGASLAHRHDADVFVYVLEGSIITQVDGKPPVTLRVGEVFHENPDDVHRQSANASQTEPAKFLVFMVKDRDKAASRPVP